MGRSQAHGGFFDLVFTMGSFFNRLRVPINGFVPSRVMGSIADRAGFRLVRIFDGFNGNFVRVVGGPTIHRVADFTVNCWGGVFTDLVGTGTFVVRRSVTKGIPGLIGRVPDDIRFFMERARVLAQYESV